MHGQHQMFDPSIKTKDSLLGQAPGRTQTLEQVMQSNTHRLYIQFLVSLRPHEAGYGQVCVGIPTVDYSIAILDH